MRSSVRCGRAPIHAAHGYADPAYRPPRLPFVSVVGPVAVEIEPLRDTKEPPVVLVLMPGHVIGRPRAPGQVVGSGALKLRFDGAATVTITGIVGRALATDADGTACAMQIEKALRDTVGAGGAVGADGKPVSAAAQAELSDATVRWDPRARRFAIASGRRGPVDGPRRSSVEVLDVAGSIAGDLGVADVAPVDGRLHRHELRIPLAMLVDVRLDCWAATQAQLAAIVDDLERRFPGRGSLLTAPSLLADDLKDGDRSLRLLPEGQPIGRWGWALLEAGDSLRDRVAGAVFTAIGDLDRTPQRIRFDGTHRALRAILSPTPLVPDPLAPEHPAPRGMALALGFALAGELPAGGAAALASLDYEGLPALRLEIVSSPPNGTTQVEIVATATFQSGSSVSGPAVTRWRMPASRLKDRVILHAAVVAARGTVELYLDGEVAPDGSTKSTAQGAPRARHDMTLTIGDPDGSPVPIDVTFAHLSAEPLGPSDPRLRTAVTRAAQWPPGRAIQLAETVDGIEPGKARFATTIVAVEGDVLHVDPPIAGGWDRGRTIVYADEYFLQQAQVRRKDDLLNHLYRATGEYRVSALLDDDRAERAPVQVVEGVDLDFAAAVPAPPDIRERAGA
jgi:hypothetical protein